MNENASLPGLADSSHMNNSLTTSYTDNVSTVASVVFTTTATVTLMLNVTCVVVCIKTLQNKFQNLVVLALSFSDSTMSLGALIMVITAFTSSNGVNNVVCLVELTMVFCGVFTTYCLIILLCLQRYFTVKSFNFGTNEHLNKTKFGYVGGTLLLPFLYTAAVTVLTPHKSHVDRCNGAELYGDNYFVYTAFIASCLTLLVVIVFTIAGMTGFRLWKTFFKPKNKILPISGNNTYRDHTVSISDCHVIVSTERLGRSERFSVICPRLEAKNDERQKVQPSVHDRIKQPKRNREFDYQLDGETNTVMPCQHDGSGEEDIKDETTSVMSPRKITYFLEDSSTLGDLGIEETSGIDVVECDSSSNKGIFVDANPERIFTCDKDNNDHDEHGKHKNGKDDQKGSVIKSTKPISVWEDKGSISKHKKFTSTHRTNSCLVFGNQYSRETTDYLQHGSVHSLDNKISVRQRIAWEKRAFITCMLLAISTVVFTCPMIVMLYLDMSGNLLSNKTKSIGFLPLLVNSFLNPFVYAWRIPEIKEEFKRIFRIPIQG